MSHEYPDFFARFYDTIYGELRDSVDRAWYLARIAECQGPVLEIGVGTGRLLRDALARGADVWGVDVSPAMIAELHRKTDPAHHHRVWVADARTLSTERRFSLILAPFRVLSHMLTVEDQLAFLERVHAHLAPGGRFLFDLYVPSPRMLAEGLSNVVDFEGEHAPGRRLRRITSARSNVVEQLTDVTMELLWDEADGTERRSEFTFPMRFYFRFELEHLIARSPLRLEHIFGDFEGNPLGRDSRELVVVCRRAEDA